MSQDLVVFMTKNVMPRYTDALVQFVLLGGMIWLWQRWFPDPEDFPHTWAASWVLSYLVFWVAQNRVHKKILLLRASRAESNAGDLPDGVYVALSNASVPHQLDAAFQVAAVHIFAEIYPTWFSWVPQPFTDHFWIVILLVFWMSQNFFLRAFLKGRVRNAFYEKMYYLGGSKWFENL